jgi:tetratricopeptide (TPR) repeat protein/phage shock protein PspC (stress-responsive transcriptional regulator)
MSVRSKGKVERIGPEPRSPGRWTRVNEGAVLVGVCTGLARMTDLPVWLWRLVFLGSLLLVGLGAPVYLGFWLAMKRDPAPIPTVERFFRRIDWWTALVTTGVVLLGYMLTLAPNLTLEDSGELAVGSFYAGVPHPPGYPVWTIYSWLFTVLLPFSNIAWRVAVSSAVAAAFSCGLVALMASRGSSMILESLQELKSLDRRMENALCMVAGYAAGALVGFNGVVWSQAVIVEVYTLSLLSFTVVMATLLRWIHAPHQLRFLYWSLFAFGICFTNHQTLIVAAVGIEVAIAAAHPRLGRDLFALNSVIFLGGLALKARGTLTVFEQNPPLYAIFLVIGVLSIAAYAYLAMQTGKLVEQRTVFIGVCLGLFWILGAAFYFYMPIASMTNPPMNWGYARTWEGFLHALTRGQYERANPTSDLGRFMEQMMMLMGNAIEEFHVVWLVIGLVPFLFFTRLKRREQAWLAGLVALFMCLGVLLMILLNPSADRQSRELNRVFFTASQVVIALFVGYGVAIFGALLTTQYERFRLPAVYAGAVASAVALYSVTVTFARDQEAYQGIWSFFGLEPTWDPLLRFTAVFGLVLALAATTMFILARTRAPMTGLLALFVVMPAESMLSNWSDNEQRGHLFGYWFGHDMFAPPFDVYPPMARDAILFGGTDPGRFAPTYMIFAESFTPARCKLDPEFDRRDVYIITQNALADQTYLQYIRAHYFRSDQIDPPFFAGMIAGLQEKLMDREQVDRKYLGQPHTTNALARAFGRLEVLARPADNFFTELGARVEARRRAQGVYPPKEIYTPTFEDHGRCMAEYWADAQRRLQIGALRPGELVAVGPDGKLQVSGQVAVMAINGLLTQVIFENNPDHEFYVEESFPLEWMYPHLEPYGIIMRINREPLPEITQAMVERDHEFWSRYSERLIGNWITYDTTVQEVADFAVRRYQRKDYEGFTGDRKFVRDSQAQKAFSKLRSSLGGLYSWRASHSVGNPEEQARVLKEAEFALKQAFAFCPYSPEAVYRYTDLLARTGRIDDARVVAETFLRFDPGNQSVQALLIQIQMLKAGAQPMSAPAQPDQRVAELEAQWRANPGDGVVAFELASLYLHLWRTNDAILALERLGNQPGVDANTLLSVANVFAQMGQGDRLERVLRRLVDLTPDSAEAWYDLASTQAILGKADEAMENLAQAIRLADERRSVDPSARDLRADALTNRGFSAMQNRPDYRQLMRP